MGDGESPPPYFFKNMGRGKLGGTKAKIRGKVGSEIYQVTRNDAGQVVQKVYQAPESREYTNTEPQARARMIMGQIERMFHILPDIIKYAFNTIPDGTLSFQNFSKINYGLLKQDADEHWQGGSMFDWRPKFDVTAPAGVWILTKGDLEPFRWGSAHFDRMYNNSLQLTWPSPNDDPTIGDLFRLCGMESKDKLKILFYVKRISTGKPKIVVINCRLNPQYNLATKLSDTFVDDVFLYSSDFEVFVDFDVANMEIDLTVSGDNIKYQYVAACAAFIIVRESRKGNKFSSSSFQWMIDETPNLYPHNSPSAAFQSWLEL